MANKLITDDCRMTSDRRKIAGLYAKRHIVPVAVGRPFGCDDCPKCRAANPGNKMMTGTWAYIGSSYGKAKIKGKFRRVLVVAMDRGGKKERERLAFEWAQSDFRRNAETPSEANGHMGGTGLIMKELVDIGVPQEIVARQFALTNAVKCRWKTGNMGAVKNKNVIEHCSKHLKAELATLLPDIIVTQGGHPAETVLRLLNETNPRAAGGCIATYHNSGEGRRRRYAEIYRFGEVILLTTPHPTRLKGLRRKHSEVPAFLRRAIKRVREEL